jgi:hypothetical protein
MSVKMIIIATIILFIIFSFTGFLRKRLNMPVGSADYWMHIHEIKIITINSISKFLFIAFMIYNIINLII